MRLSDRGLPGSLPVREWTRGSGPFLAGLGLWLALVPSAAHSRELPRPDSMRPAIEFWKGIFASYSEKQVVVHDAWYLGKVYEVLDFRNVAVAGEPLDLEGDSIKRAQVAQAKEHWRQVLLELDAAGGNPAGFGEEHHRAARLFADSSDPGRFAAAADRLRTQQGLRERFSAGVARQARYLPEMEAIFRNEGVPVEIVRLPLVESCFNVEAYSKVGAAGPWQFMPSTGRQYMKVGSHLDERRDPIRATQAAARHLRKDYESLGAWPLAVTAYNHGRGGLHRAVRETGTSDIGTIVQQYRGPAFGFASRNFYAELVAALEITEGEQRYFPSIRHDAPVVAHEIPLDRSMGLREVARRLDLSTEDLVVQNPAFLSPIASGRAPVPAGYRLRVPGAGRSFDEVQVALATGSVDPMPAADPTDEADDAVASPEADATERTEEIAEPRPSRRPSVAAASSATLVASRTTRRDGGASSRRGGASRSVQVRGSRGGASSKGVVRAVGTPSERNMRPVIVGRVEKGHPVAEVARRPDKARGTAVANSGRPLPAKEKAAPPRARGRST